MHGLTTTQRINNLDLWSRCARSAQWISWAIWWGDTDNVLAQVGIKIAVMIWLFEYSITYSPVFAEPSKGFFLLIPSPTLQSILHLHHRHVHHQAWPSPFDWSHKPSLSPSPVTLGVYKGVYMARSHLYITLTPFCAGSSTWVKNWCRIGYMWVSSHIFLIWPFAGPPLHCFISTLAFSCIVYRI